MKHSLRTDDVAERLGTSVAAVYKLVQRGVLQVTRRGRGKPLIFDPLSVEAEANRRKKDGGFLGPEARR